MCSTNALERLRVIIPVGGKATRLLPLTAETSKAFVRLLNRPMIDFSLLPLARQGIRNFIFGVKARALRHVTVSSNESKPTSIDSVSVVADDVVITEGSVLSGTRIYPHQRVGGSLINQTLVPN